MTKKKRAPLSPLTVIGELLLLCGLGVLGYIVWQPWFATQVVGSHQSDLAADQSAQWADSTGSTDGVPVPKTGENGNIFGVLYVPALGKDWSNVVAESVDRPDPLDDWNKGVGHYSGTGLPGKAGNFALAAHRNGPLAPFRDMEYLRIGDDMYFETEDGWYTYNFRTEEVVTEDATEVIDPYPYLDGKVGDDGMMTLTSCYPKNGAALRIIAFASFDHFTPRSEGPPEDLAKVNPNVGKKAA
jgi:sortase A